MINTVAVTGATGYVGKFVVPHLQAEGFHVRALARSTSDRSGFSEDVQWVLGDIEDAAARYALVAEADAVVHLAYTHVPGHYRGGEGDDLSAWLKSNLTASIELLADARAANVGQFIFLSSRAVFSKTEEGRVLDESHPTSPDTHYGAYKAAVEAMLGSFSAVEGMRTTAIRATGVYGVTWPIEKSKWWELIQDTMSNSPIHSNRGGTEVHGQDVAKTVAALLHRPTKAPDLVHLSDLYVTNRQIVEIARDLSNRPGPLPPPPDRPMSNALVCPRLSQLGIELGGERLLRQTIQTLVQAALSA